MASYTQEQRERAVALFNELGSATATVRRLGYPSRQRLYAWANRDDAARRRTCGARYQHYDPAIRFLAVEMFRESGDAMMVADALGVSSAAIVYNWARKSERDGRRARMADGTEGKPTPVAGPGRSFDDFDGDLAEKVRRLELENDILRGAVDLLKAEGLDTMTNMEKTVLINGLRQRTGRPLKELIGFLRISKSSYEYCRGAMAAGDKYAGIRAKVVSIFDAADGRRGYRYVRHRLAAQGSGVSEKVVRRIMAEEGCRVVYAKKAKRYSSYAGEISDAPKNLVKRNFHADAPNRLWLTDITEFALPCGKCYLSPVLDCFDGKVVSWSIGTSPNAHLANSSLRKATSQLRKGDQPICHSDSKNVGSRFCGDGDGAVSCKSGPRRSILTRTPTDWSASPGTLTRTAIDAMSFPGYVGCSGRFRRRPPPPRPVTQEGPDACDASRCCPVRQPARRGRATQTLRQRSRTCKDRSRGKWWSASTRTRRYTWRRPWTGGERWSARNASRRPGRATGGSSRGRGRWATCSGSA